MTMRFSRGPAGDLPLAFSARHPAMLLLLGVVAACLVASVSFLPNETDFWQHLLVGRAIWETRQIPHAQLWTWPTYGTPDVLPSWGFRFLIWPFWKLGGVWGLFLWRWLTTLAAFGLVWMTARRMGARGCAALVALVLCGLAYRSRAQVRPETLVAVLLALELWVLETRRQGGADRTLLLVAVACVWANLHVSYYLGFVLAGCYLLDERRRGVPALGRLGAVMVAMVAASFLNPFGWRALWQPFDFAFHGRMEIIFRDILELQPVDWRNNLSNGLPLLVLGWPALIIWRARRRGFDLAEALLFLFFTAAGVSMRRFIGFYAVVAAPFLMRDLDEWIAGRRWPRWSANGTTRVALASVLCVGICLPEWTRRDLPLEVGLRMERYPVAACDFIAAQGIRGRAFNPFYFGGYLLYRFWPDRTRLPFMDIHQAGTPKLRLRYLRAFYRPIGWAELDRRYRFDWVLLDRVQAGADRLLDFLDADTSFSLVFLDDAAALYVRSQGTLSPVAERFGYRFLPAGTAGRRGRLQASLADSALRRPIISELEREASGSRWNATASSALADLALFEGRLADARASSLRVLEVTPRAIGTHGRLGRVALAEGRPRDALREYDRERTVSGPRPSTLLGIANAWRRLGESDRARVWYQRTLARDPGSQEARDSLAILAAESWSPR